MIKIFFYSKQKNIFNTDVNKSKDIHNYNKSSKKSEYPKLLSKICCKTNKTQSKKEQPYKCIYFLTYAAAIHPCIVITHIVHMITARNGLIGSKEENITVENYLPNVR